MTTKYRLKSKTIDAYCYDLKPDNHRPDWFVDKLTVNEIVTYPDSAVCRTPEGCSVARLGDWIILLPSGDLIVCKRDVFGVLYKEIDNVPSNVGLSCKDCPASVPPITVGVFVPMDQRICAARLVMRKDLPMMRCSIIPERFALGEGIWNECPLFESLNNAVKKRSP